MSPLCRRPSRFTSLSSLLFPPLPHPGTSCPWKNSFGSRHLAPHPYFAPSSANPILRVCTSSVFLFRNLSKPFALETPIFSPSNPKTLNQIRPYPFPTPIGPSLYLYPTFPPPPPAPHFGPLRCVCPLNFSTTSLSSSIPLSFSLSPPSSLNPTPRSYTHKEFRGKGERRIRIGYHTLPTLLPPLLSPRPLPIPSPFSLFPLPYSLPSITLLSPPPSTTSSLYHCLRSICLYPEPAS